MIGAESLADLVGRPFARFLLRGDTDTRQIAKADRPGTLATPLLWLLRQRLPVKVAPRDPPGGWLGVVLRDVAVAVAGVTRAAEKDTPLPDATILSRGGTMPPRGIVAATTDAIERQGIAQAIALTGSHRLAAAEVLGLSRQSLSMKLRRFGLGPGDGEAVDRRTRKESAILIPA